MADGDLAGLSDAMLWLGVSSDDNDIVARLITATSSAIQKWLGYQIASASYDRVFNGNGGRRLMLPDRPVTAVASLTIDGIAIPASTGAFVDGYVFDDKMIYLRGCYQFCRGAQNVEATYTAGYSAVPGDIAQACLDWVKLTYDNLDTLPGLSKIKAGDSEIDYGSVTTELGKTVILMPPVVAAKLQPYRRVAQT